jgi:hypothetical protein
MTPVSLDEKLTERKWNSEKSLFAKLKTKTNETGVSAALKSLAAAHKAVKWEEIEAKKTPGEYPSASEVTEQMKKVAAEIGKINTLIGAAKAVNKQAEIALPLFKDSKLIPAKSTQFVRTLIGETDLLDAELKTALKTAGEVLKDLNEIAKAKAQGF